MSSVYEITKAFTPVFKETLNRVKTNQVTPLDLRIAHLHNMLDQNRSAANTTTLDDFKAANSHLSKSLTLSDLKTSLECCPEGAGLIVTYLNLQQNFDKIKATFPVIERIQTVSEHVLKQVSLFDLQITEFIVPLKHSPVWYALAADEEFLNRQVLDCKEFRLNGSVAAARIQDIEERNPTLLNTLRDAPFHAPGVFGTLDLTLGKLRLLSGKELNSIGGKLPPIAGKLFTDHQIRSINFKLFSGDLLDEMIAGNGTDEETSRRLGVLSSDQIKVFLKKSSGKHFHKLPDSFYQIFPLSRLKKKQVEALLDDHYGLQGKEAVRHLHLISPQEIAKGFHLLPRKLTRMLSDTQLAFLPLSTLKKEQVEALFDDHYGMQEKEAVRRLHLISPQEIAKGFHLLPEKFARMLSDTQLASLNYAHLNKKQIDSVFSYFLPKEERKRRIQLIPERFVNDVIKTNSRIVEYLSSSQYRVLNTALLDQETLQRLFPGFTIDTLHPGHIYTIKERSDHDDWHEFTSVGMGSMSGYSKEELDEKLQKNKASCANMAKNFSSEQLRIMMPLMHPECQELIVKNNE